VVGDAVTWKTRGDSLAEAARLQEAVSCYQQALKVQPAFVEAHNNLGNALVRLARFDEALGCYQQVVRLRPDIAEPYSNLSRVLLDLKRYDEAIAAGTRAVQINPRLAEAHANLGNALLDSDRVREAIASYHKALALDANYPEVHNSLGNAERSQAMFDRAIAHYHRAVALNPRYAEAHADLGATLRLMGRTSEAEDSCGRALAFDPGNVAAMATLAEIQVDQGQFGAAQELLQQVVKQAPGHVEAWVSLGRVRRMTAADGDWRDGVLKLLDQPLRPRERVSLNYALGKYFDDTGEFGRAFAHYDQANVLSRSLVPKHDRIQTRNETDRLIAQFDRSSLATLSRQGNPSTRPVFVVGMPRSGTSLAEQILASHPQVRGAGELTWWHRAAHATDRQRLHDLADTYLQLLSRVSPDALRVVDKMPTNFLALGAIHAALPRARIIHMRRHPIDTCLSIYFQDFGANISYANDLTDLASFYREYERIMQHWREVLPPEALLEVPYEELVAAQEHWSRRMIEFTGLAWDPQCLQFHTTSRSVVTASKWQVRQPLNSGSIQRWRHYETCIQPLLSLQSSSDFAITAACEKI
jgi:tetratricopeptide (TPR) repeat protein